MKILIDLPEKTYSYVTSELKDLETDGSVIVDLVRGVVNGSIVPDNVIVLDKEIANKMLGPAYYDYQSGAKFTEGDGKHEER